MDELQIVLNESSKVISTFIASKLCRLLSLKDVNENKIEESLTKHLQYVKNWSDEIIHRDHPEWMQLNSLFIEQILTDGENSKQPTSKPSKTWNNLLEPGYHTIIKGYPGSGKTTICKKLCNFLLTNSQKDGNDCYEFPLLLRVRDINNYEHVITPFLSPFGIDIPKETIETDKDQLFDSLINLLSDILNQKQILLIIDGIDELRPDKTAAFNHIVTRLSRLVDKSDMLITVRTAVSYPEISRFRSYHITPFTDQQIQEYVNNWFGNEEQKTLFLSALKNTPYFGTAIRPLTLTNICIIFEKFGEIPSPPTEMYRRIINLYLTKWDEERQIKRVSKYGKFSPEKKQDFLAYLSYDMAKKRIFPTFNLQHLREAYNSICDRFDLPKEEMEKVLEELESHTGLLIKCGFDSYEFYHKSIQEYLSAEVITRIPSLSSNISHLMYMPDECAIATCLSAEPSSFLSFLCLRVFERTVPYNLSSDGIEAFSKSFWAPYFSRLFFEDVRFDCSDLLALSALIIASYLWTNDNGSTNTFRKRSNYSGLYQYIEKFFRLEQVQKSLLSFSSKIEQLNRTEQTTFIGLKDNVNIMFFGSVPRNFVVNNEFVSNLLK